MDLVLRRHIDEVLQTQANLQQQSAGCLLTDIGDTLVQMAALNAHLSSCIVNNHDFLRQNAKTVSETVYRHTDGADSMLIIDYLDEKGKLLSELDGIFRDTSEKIKRVWSQAAPPPSHLPSSTSPAVVSLLAGGLGVHHMAQVAPPTPVPNETSLLLQPAALSASNKMEVVEAIDMSRLKTRGKGMYSCPQGIACRKGGVRKTGEVVVFKRNSEFRAHMAKHQKQWRCDLPGCSNKTGFAREDQLRRHQQTVSHGRRP